MKLQNTQTIVTGVLERKLRTVETSKIQTIVEAF
jgi:hypothetical protein